MAGEFVLRGSKPQGAPPPSMRYEKDRICSFEGSATKLSVYNRRDRCWVHAEWKTPRLRGKPTKPAGNRS